MLKLLVHPQGARQSAKAATIRKPRCMVLSARRRADIVRPRIYTQLTADLFPTTPGGERDGLDAAVR